MLPMFVLERFGLTIQETIPIKRSTTTSLSTDNRLNDTNLFRIMDQLSTESKLRWIFQMDGSQPTSSCSSLFPAPPFVPKMECNYHEKVHPDVVEQLLAQSTTFSGQASSKLDFHD